MKKIQRVQRSRRRGAKLPPKTKCVNRPTKWGNPFVVHRVRHYSLDYYRVSVNTKDRIKKELCTKILTDYGWAGFNFKTGAANHAAMLFGVLMERDPDFYDLAEFEKVDNIACFCKVGEPCHGDEIIKRIYAQKLKQ